MSGYVKSRADILKSLRNRLAEAEREYTRVEALNIRSVIDGMQYDIDELEADPENAMQNESPAPPAVQDPYSKEKRRAALRALEERKKARRAEEERKAEENAIEEEKLLEYSSHSMPAAAAAAAAAAPVSSPHSPIRPAKVPVSPYGSPEYKIGWNTGGPSPSTWRRHQEWKAQQNYQKRLAEYSPNWRTKTSRANLYQKRPNARATRYGPLKKWSGNKTARQINFSGQRRITNYLKRRNRATPPKNATRRNRK
jgi:hypothetical protein